MQTYIKIGGQEYAAGITGTDMDTRWNYRKCKTIRLEMPYETAAALFQDNVPWSIIEREETPVLDENGEPTGEVTTEQNEYDNSGYCVAGDITDHRDGTVSVKMGKKTQLETEQELRKDAETAAKILLGEEK